MDNINSYINVEFYYLLIEIIPGFVAIKCFEVISKSILKFF